MNNNRPNEDCPMCQGTGVVTMDDEMTGYSFADFTCECVKEEN